MEKPYNKLGLSCAKLKLSSNKQLARLDQLGKVRMAVGI